MKRLIFSLFFAVMAVVAVNAQQIAVVSGSGATSVYQTLAKAIEEADPGSTIYLPGGGFQISDDVKITKRLNIIGIGHKAVSENADGNTVISGNIFFNSGSDNSAIMGCYISGNVKIGYDESSVNNILIKYCNLNAVEIYGNLCTGTVVNQNYIREKSSFNGAGVNFTNNICKVLGDINGGIIKNNIFTTTSTSSGVWVAILVNVYNSLVSDNIFISNSYSYGGGFDTYGNMCCTNWGQGCRMIGDVNWNDVFVDYNNGAVSPASNFHFKGDYQQYEGEVGIYGGTEPFSESALPPVPYIVSKVIPEQTDASGKLNIKIRVKAGE